MSPGPDKTFEIGLVLKGLDGVLDVAGGIVLLFVSPHAIEHLARLLTSHELNLDPHDLIARYVGDRDGCPHIGQRSDVAEPPIG